MGRGEGSGGRRTVDVAEDLDDAGHLVALERDAALLAATADLDLGFLAFEHGAQAEEFAKDAADGPLVDRGGVVSRAEEEFGRAVPNSHDNLS